MIELMLKHVYTKKIAVKYQFFENLDFNEKEPKTSGFIDFSTSNIQIFHADACVRCCAGTPTPRDSRTHASAWKI